MGTREDKELEYRRRLASLGKNHLKTLQAKMSFARSIDDPTMSDLAVKTAEEAERGIASLLGEQHPLPLAVFPPQDHLAGLTTPVCSTAG